MLVIKQIIGLLLVAVMVTVACYFFPFVNDLLEDYIIGFFIVAIVLPVGLAMYKSHMTEIEKLPPDVRAKSEKENQDQREESSQATFSPSQPLDLRNVTNDDSLIK